MILGGEILRLASVTSTMDVVDERARAGAPEGLVVVADEQTAGRGRAGRSWLAPPGSSLLCSVLLRPRVSPARLGTLPLLAGVAVAEAIESSAAVSCALKWPNDVLIAGRKVAGILVQSRLSPRGIDFVNVGIGVNLNVPAEALPEGATSVALASGATIDREEMLGVMLDRLEEQYREFVASGGHPDLGSWTRRAAMLGEPVTVQLADGSLTGMFEGIDDVGRMLLALQSGGVVALADGEVTRGPRSSAGNGG